MSDKMPPKHFFCPPSCLFCSAVVQKITHWLPRIGEFRVKAGYDLTLLPSRVARLARTPCLHVNRALEKQGTNGVFNLPGHREFLFLHWAPGLLLLPIEKVNNISDSRNNQMRSSLISCIFLHCFYDRSDRTATCHNRTYVSPKPY